MTDTDRIEALERRTMALATALIESLTFSMKISTAVATVDSAKREELFSEARQLLKQIADDVRVSVRGAE